METAGYESRDGAWVHPEARVGSEVTLGPGAVIGARVELGSGCRIDAGAVVLGTTRLGQRNRVHSGAVIGGDPQDVSYAGEQTRLEVGDDNVFREGVTISRGSTRARGVTKVGSRNYFMALSHVGHDCVIEDGCVFANQVMIAGHCHVGSGANFAGGSAIVQFTTVGRLAFLGGLAGARCDLEPFIRHDVRAGRSVQTASPVGINRIALERAGLAPEAIAALASAYKILIRRGGEDLDRARAAIESRCGLTEEIEELIEFLRRKRAGRFGRQLAHS